MENHSFVTRRHLRSLYSSTLLSQKYSSHLEMEAESRKVALLWTNNPVSLISWSIGHITYIAVCLGETKYPSSNWNPHNRIVPSFDADIICLPVPSRKKATQRTPVSTLSERRFAKAFVIYEFVIGVWFSFHFRSIYNYSSTDISTYSVPSMLLDTFERDVGKIEIGISGETWRHQHISVRQLFGR